MDQHDREARAEQARGIAADLGERGIAAIAVTWVDTSGVTRVKTVPTARLGHAAAWGIGASPVFDVYLVDDSAVTGRFAGGPAGDLRLHPDLDRLTALAAQPGWAWAPADRYQQDGTPHPGDPRLLAQQAVTRLADTGLTAQVAFEVEWCVSRGDGDEFVPASSGPAYGMARLVELPDYLRGVLEALSAQGIAVEQLHPEYAVGQFEVSVAATDPVGAADLLVLVRETLRAVGHRHGLRTTFAPKVVAGGVGNGGHVHLSLWRDGTNLMSDGDGWHGLTELAEAFGGGILDRLPGLLAIGAPSVASYLRLVPSHWAGPYRCWGWENREAALRLVSGEAGHGQRAANLEVKCFDGAANPYLVVAGLLAAGTAGIAEQAALPEPIQVDPASLPEGTVQRLPASLGEAATAFEADPALRKAFGEELVDTVLTVRRGELALFDGLSAEEVVARTRWRY
ncbi:glutamine synthetase family protein [Amycolatopsis magusensis]|uniref:Glutamine synthetase n=1 Tax=Amycolatopsis magusensis TaxID=882444 RepID=A0ABS4PSQ7_9PSEU|nr:glutamine synthetase family protein [Amycolatopsis magusensis]MBP2182467.1 glutamine synthetase [Amycolatopsis magusensis]MDI5982036.1 glutamine synthetase family protein [Amycolatopsis magusensis]